MKWSDLCRDCTGIDFLEQFLRTKSVTKKEMNKCMAEIYDPGGIRPIDKPIP